MGSPEQKQAQAAVRGRLQVAGVNLPVRDKNRNQNIKPKHNDLMKCKILHRGLRDAGEKQNKAEEEQTGGKSK